MKKRVFLILSALAILFCGCSTGTGYGLLKANSYSMINSNTHPPLGAADCQGVCLPISAKSSVNIDVEGILEYVQKDTVLDQAEAQIDFLNPWIRLNYAF